MRLEKVQILLVEDIALRGRRLTGDRYFGICVLNIVFIRTSSGKWLGVSTLGQLKRMGAIVAKASKSEFQRPSPLERAKAWVVITLRLPWPPIG